MNVAVLVHLAVHGVQYAQLIELLGRLRAVFEHGAHGGVAVDVGVVALHVRLARLVERQLVHRLHQPRIGFADARTFGAVQYVLLGGAHQPVLDENGFHLVLHLFDGRNVVGRKLLHDLLRQRRGARRVVNVRGFQGLVDGAGDLRHIESDSASVSFYDLFHTVYLSVFVNFTRFFPTQYIDWLRPFLRRPPQYIVVSPSRVL